MRKNTAIQTREENKFLGFQMGRAAQRLFWGNARILKIYLYFILLLLLFLPFPLFHHFSLMPFNFFIFQKKKAGIVQIKTIINLNAFTPTPSLSQNLVISSSTKLPYSPQKRNALKLIKILPHIRHVSAK